MKFWEKEIGIPTQLVNALTTIHLTGSRGQVSKVFDTVEETQVELGKIQKIINRKQYKSYDQRNSHRETTITPDFGQNIYK